MHFTSMLAIYALFWSLSLFLVLPFRLTHGEGDDAYIPGQAESAPQRFSMRRTALWTTVVASALFGLFWVNYVEGWVTPAAFDFYSSHYHGG